MYRFSNSSKKKSTKSICARSTIINSAVQSMHRRYRYSYNVFDYLYNLTWPLTEIPCRKKNLLSLYNRYRLYKKGEEKYIKEFDAVYFARSLRKLKMLVASMMDDSERFLSVYQHFNTIKIGSSESDSSESHHAKIPKLLGTKQVRDKHEQLINEFMDKYLQERFSPKDYRLMNCVKTKKELTNQQLYELEVSKLDSNEDYFTESPRISKAINDNEEQKIDPNSSNTNIRINNQNPVFKDSMIKLFTLSPKTQLKGKNKRNKKKEDDSLSISKDFAIPQMTYNPSKHRNLMNNDIKID